MFLEVIGGSKSQKKHTQGMVEFCANKLMPRLYNLDITVRLCKPKGALGYCLELEDKRTFELEIDRTQPLRQLLETVAHEMVHVKQFARGELDSKYKGMRWKTAHITDDVKYMDLPWEKEAYKMEDKLAAKFWSENLI